MRIHMKNLILKLEKEHKLTKSEWVQLINGRTQELAEFLFERTRAVRHTHYGKDVYIRGLIEFTNYCKNNCYYCGIRAGNSNVSRYRLTREQILQTVWGYDFFGDDRTLDTHIKLLRRSLGKYADYIVTLRGVGYRFDTGKIL